MDTRAALNPEEARRLVAKHGGIRAAARASGLNYSTVHKWYNTPTSEPVVVEDDEIDVNDLPDYDAVKSRIERYNPAHIRRFHKSHYVQKKVPHKPFLIWFMGDPHRDSPGHDTDMFNAHLDVVREAQERHTVLPVNMGDILDHWPTGGRLGKKHHDSHLTRAESLSLVRGLLQEEGIDWALHILGNHDAWPGVDFATLMKQWTRAPVVDWGCVFEVVTERGWNWTTFVAHDMAGHSMYNELHGLMRRAREDGGADLYVAGHRHTAAQGKAENAHRNRMYHSLRVGSYKKADEYAWNKGYGEQTEGASAFALINPLAKTMDGQCRTFLDLEEGLFFADQLCALHP